MPTESLVDAELQQLSGNFSIFVCWVGGEDG